MTRSNVVVIGGGFGGLYATRRLARGHVDITVHVPDDHLIVAIGVQQFSFGHDDIAPHAPG